MAFFEEFGKRVSDFGKDVATKSKNSSEVSRLKGVNAQLEQQIASVYADIGACYYRRHKDDAGAEEREKLDFITNAYEQIHQNEEQIKRIRGIAPCPHCGADVSVDAPFCSSCGQPTGFVPPRRLCPNCSAQTTPGAAFCTACGTRLPSEQPIPQPPVERYCTTCGNKLSPENTFCPNCGTVVEQNT